MGTEASIPYSLRLSWLLMRSWIRLFAQREGLARLWHRFGLRHWFRIRYGQRLGHGQRFGRQRLRHWSRHGVFLPQQSWRRLVVTFAPSAYKLRMCFARARSLVGDGHALRVSLHRFGTGTWPAGRVAMQTKVAGSWKSLPPDKECGQGEHEAQGEKPKRTDGWPGQREPLF